MAATFSVIASVAFLAAAPVASASAPKCESEVWSRPGLERAFVITCRHADRVRIAQPPTDATITGDSFDGTYFRFRLATDSDASEADSLVLDLDGPGGQTRHVITIHNVPLSQNTPPRCEAINTAQRTDGDGPAVVRYRAYCADDEHDDITIHGGGPGVHLDDPVVIPGGWREERIEEEWRYRTLVSTGAELTSYWGVDSQGARGLAAPVSLMIGPLVDRPPVCRTNEGNLDPTVVFMRPGVRRNFHLLCEDPDGDDLDARLVSPPLMGTLTRFELGDPYRGWWGTERWIDATYVPDGNALRVDPFTVAASGPGGPGAVSVIRMHARSLPENNGFGCGWSPATTFADEPVSLRARCNDGDGDPISAEIVEGPSHGTAETPISIPGRLGEEAISIRYTPEPGFLGIDFLTIQAGDGHFAPQAMEFEIRVEPKPPPTTPDPDPPAPEPSTPPPYSPGADPDGWFWSPDGWRRSFQTPPPSQGQARAIAPIDQARRALRTRSVRLVRRLGGVLVFAPRRALKLSRRSRALAVTCPVQCRVSAAGVMPPATSSRRSGVTAEPGRAHVIFLRLNARQRRRIVQARSRRAIFRVRARPVKTRARSARIALRVRR